jgi:tryptophan-rich sensory protein
MASRIPISREILGLAGWLLLTFVAAAIGALGSASAPDFYAQLSRPAWAPPAGAFGPVWTVLYALMGVAAWLVWRAHGFHRGRGALTLYAMQLAANALWSWLFFAWHRGGLAFVEALLLWALIAATLLAFARLHRLAAVLLLPYLAWVGFACVLTWTLWQGNPQLLG